MVVLASCDGDYDMLVNKVVKNLAVSVEVFGVAQLTANSLKFAASRFVPIEDNLLLKSTK